MTFIKIWSYFKYFVISVTLIGGLATGFQFGFITGTLIMIISLPLAIVLQLIENRFAGTNNRSENVLRLQDANLHEDSSKRKSESFNVKEIVDAEIKLAIDDWIRIYRTALAIGYRSEIRMTLFCENDEEDEFHFYSDDGKSWSTMQSDDQTIDIICVYLECQIEIVLETLQDLPRKIGRLQIDGGFSNFGRGVEGKWSLQDDKLSARFGSSGESTTWDIDGIDARDLPSIGRIARDVSSSLTKRANMK